MLLKKIKPYNFTYYTTRLEGTSELKEIIITCPLVHTTQCKQLIHRSETQILLYEFIEPKSELGSDGSLAEECTVRRRNVEESVKFGDNENLLNDKNLNKKNEARIEGNTRAFNKKSSKESICDLQDTTKDYESDDSSKENYESKNNRARKKILNIDEEQNNCNQKKYVNNKKPSQNMNDYTGENNNKKLFYETFKDENDLLANAYKNELQKNQETYTDDKNFEEETKNKNKSDKKSKKEIPNAKTKTNLLNKPKLHGKISIINTNNDTKPEIHQFEIQNNKTKLENSIYFFITSNALCHTVLNEDNIIYCLSRIEEDVCYLYSCFCLNNDNSKYLMNLLKDPSRCLDGFDIIEGEMDTDFFSVESEDRKISNKICNELTMNFYVRNQKNNLKPNSNKEHQIRGMNYQMENLLKNKKETIIEINEDKKNENKKKEITNVAKFINKLENEIKKLYKNKDEKYVKENFDNNKNDSKDNADNKNNCDDNNGCDKENDIERNNVDNTDNKNVEDNNETNKTATEKFDDNENNKKEHKNNFKKFNSLDKLKSRIKNINDSKDCDKNISSNSETKSDENDIEMNSIDNFDMLSDNENSSEKENIKNLFFYGNIGNKKLYLQEKKLEMTISIENMEHLCAFVSFWALKMKIENIDFIEIQSETDFSILKAEDEFLFFFFDQVCVDDCKKIVLINKIKERTKKIINDYEKANKKDEELKKKKNTK
ncbi:hypothetical protein COBT_001529 [Conglomerata obtusa]